MHSSGNFITNTSILPIQCQCKYHYESSSAHESYKFIVNTSNIEIYPSCKSFSVILSTNSSLADLSSKSIVRMSISRKFIVVSTSILHIHYHGRAQSIYIFVELSFNACSSLCVFVGEHYGLSVYGVFP